MRRTARRDVGGDGLTDPLLHSKLAKASLAFHGFPLVFTPRGAVGAKHEQERND